ncbi:MAG: hypothetical protein K2X69_06020 [Silvanigrellaceae bacterium]|nr:hypothetical protein [Silvanigrellaceae bacterium]
MAKFETGDTVVNLDDIYLWNNPYHYKKFLNNMSSTVFDFNDKLFSVDNKVSVNTDIPDPKNMQALNIYSQVDGYSYGDVFKVVYHLEKDKEIIVEELEKSFSKAEIEVEKFKNEEIERIETAIEELQLKLKNIKEDNETDDNPVYKRAKFNNACKNAILNLLKLK